MEAAGDGRIDGPALARRTATLTFFVLLSFAVATAILICLAEAFHLRLDFLRWHLCVAASVALTSFSVWISQRAENSREIDYPVATLLLAFGSIASIGSKATQSGFDLLDGNEAITATSILGLLLQQAAPDEAALLHFVLTSCGMISAVVVSALTVCRPLALGSRSTRHEARLYTIALALLVYDALLQDWVRADFVAQTTPSYIWLAPLFACLALLIALLSWTSEGAAAFNAAVAEACARVGDFSARTSRIIAVNAAVGFLAGSALCVGVIAGAFATPAAIAWALGLTEVAAQIMGSALVFARTAAPGAVAALSTASLAALLLVGATFALRGEPFRQGVSGARRAVETLTERAPRLLKEGADRIQLALPALATAFVLTAFFGGLFALSPYFEDAYAGVTRFVGRVTSVELAPIAAATEKIAFIVLGFASALALAVCAIVVGVVLIVAIVQMLLWGLGQFGIAAAKGLTTLGAGAPKIVGGLAAFGSEILELASWMLAPIGRTLLRLVMGTALLAGAGILAWGLINIASLLLRIELRPIEAPFVLRSITTETAVTALFVLVAGALVLVFRKPLLDAAIKLGDGLRRVLRQILFIAVIIGVLAVFTPVYAALVFAFTRAVALVLSINVIPNLVTILDFLAPLPAIAARMLLAGLLALALLSALWGAVALLAIVSSALRSGLKRVVASIAQAIKPVIAFMLRMAHALMVSILGLILWGIGQAPAAARWMLGLLASTGIAAIVLTALIYAPPFDVIGQFVLRALAIGAAVGAGLAAIWVVWRFRMPIGRVTHRLAAIAGAIALLLIIPAHRDASDLPTPPVQPSDVPDIQITNVIADAASLTWRFASASDVSSNSGERELDAHLDQRGLCGANVIIAVGTASSDGDPAYNHVLARCRAMRLALVADSQTHGCFAPIEPTIWTLNLGARRSEHPSASDRKPWLLALSGLDPSAPETALREALVSNARLREITGGRTIADYSAQEWARWSRDEEGMHDQRTLIAMCAALSARDSAQDAHAE